jgi:hypothetical protein
VTPHCDAGVTFLVMALNAWLRPFSHQSSCAFRQGSKFQKQSLWRPSVSLLSTPSSPLVPRIHTRFITQPGQQYNNTLHNKIEKTTPPSRSAEEIWLSRSNYALTEVKDNPPANAYSGSFVHHAMFEMHS